ASFLSDPCQGASAAGGDAVWSGSCGDAALHPGRTAGPASIPPGGQCPGPSPAGPHALYRVVHGAGGTGPWPSPGLGGGASLRYPAPTYPHCPPRAGPRRKGSLYGTRLLPVWSASAGLATPHLVFWPAAGAEAPHAAARG